MLNNRPVQWFISTSWQGQHCAVGQPDFRFGDPLDEAQVQNHAPSHTVETVVQFLFKVTQGALDGVIRLCVDRHIVLMHIQITDLIERNPYHLSISFQV